MTINTNYADSSTEWPKKSLRNYVVGYLLCFILTMISFWLATYAPFNKAIIYMSLCFFAVAQMILQAVYFLGLKYDVKGRWNVLPFIFTIVIIVFLIGGSLWIMHDLNVLTMEVYMVFS